MDVKLGEQHQTSKNSKPTKIGKLQTWSKLITLSVFLKAPRLHISIVPVKYNLDNIRVLF